MRPFQLRDKKTGRLRYGGQWLIKYRTPDGSYRRQVAGSTKREAESQLRRILTAIEDGAWIDPREVTKAEREAKQRAQEHARSGLKTWGDIVERFNKVKYTKPAQKNSRRCVEYLLETLEAGFNGSGPLMPADTPIARIDEQRMEAIREALGASHLSTATKNQKRKYLRLILRWAVRQRSIPINIDPSESFGSFQDDKDSDSFNKTLAHNEVFNEAEVRKMLAYAREHLYPVNAAMFETALSTGMRRGELIGLKWSDVDFTDGIIHVFRNFDRKPKSGKTRTVPISPELLLTLKKWKAQSPCSKANDFVFPNPNGEMRGETYHFAALVKRVAERSGVLRPGLARFGHLTRHTFATLFLKAGGSDNILAEILGHANTRLVHDVYKHFCAADIKREFDRVGFTLKPESEPKCRDHLSNKTDNCGIGQNKVCLVKT